MSLLDTPQHGQAERLEERDYRPIAVGVFLAYWVFYVPGLILNLKFLVEAKELQHQIGEAPEGLGWLKNNLLLSFIPFAVQMAIFMTLVMGQG